MKKFHKRAAVFLTAATLAGLPAGAFFYSSPGSLTVWADNVEVESSEESSPEDVDFSDESEAEILADPVEQAQEDAGNDVTETPEVGITFTEPEGWQTDTATVKIQVEDTKNTGAFSIAKVEARLSENGGWSDITGNMEVSISSNCSVYVRVTDQNGNTYEQNRYIECFDKTKPTIIAAAKNGILIVQGVDAESGIAALYVNGNEFTELTNNTLNVRLQKADTSYEYFTLQAKDKTGLEDHRRKHVSLIFQNYNLIDYMTPIENTMLASKVDAIPILRRLGLKENELRRTVLKLSGGQQQRVAIARSLASDAPVILADEPTGNLDETTAAEITKILKESAHEYRKCVIIVTHSDEVARASDCVLEIRHGTLKERK